MILRRFMEHVRDQNWFAVGLDVCVVIVGIFLGMQVTEWNEVREERAQEEQYLVALSHDLDESLEILRSRLGKEQNAQQKQLDLIELANNPAMEFDDAEVIEMVHLGVFQFSRLDIQMNTRDEMLRNGTLDLILDKSLRDGLLELDQKVAEVAFRYDDMTKLVIQKIDPYLIANFPATKLVPLELVSNATEIAVQDPFADQPVGDLKSVLTDPVFHNLLAYRYTFQSTMIQSYLDLERHYLHLQDLVENRLQTVRGES